MRPFAYDRADSPEAATRLAAVPADAHAALACSSSPAARRCST